MVIVHSISTTFKCSNDRFRSCVQSVPMKTPEPGLRSFRIQQVIFRAMQHKAGRPAVIHHIKGALEEFHKKK